jgi:hypothetical protein
VNPAGSTPSRLERGLPWLLAAAALAPFIWGFRHFADLFWFGDEFDLIDQFDRIGFWSWLKLPFAENFVPLFKILWGGLVYAGGGSYLVILVVVWLTHALNVGLLACWMQRSGFEAPAVMLAGIGFGLSDTNLEALGWTVQWSAMLAVTFFLLAALYYDTIRQRGIPPSAGQITWLAVWSTASAWSFARGVLTGVVLAGLTLWRNGSVPGSPARRGAVIAACVIPALVTAGLIFFLAAHGPHHDIFSGGRWRQAVAFGTWYATLNPVVRWLDISALDWPLVVKFGALKLVVVILALVLADKSQRRLLGALLLFELGNSFLLGLGRFESPLWAATSSRYQYCSLLGSLPFFATVLQAILRPIPRPFLLRAAFTTGLLLLVAWQSTRYWPPWLSGWKDWRGLQTRSLLLESKEIPAGNNVPGIPFMTNGRARELVEKYHLH